MHWGNHRYDRSNTWQHAKHLAGALLGQRPRISLLACVVCAPWLSEFVEILKVAQRGRGRSREVEGSSVDSGVREGEENARESHRRDVMIISGALFLAGRIINRKVYLVFGVCRFRV